MLGERLEPSTTRVDGLLTASSEAKWFVKGSNSGAVDRRSRALLPRSKSGIFSPEKKKPALLPYARHKRSPQFFGLGIPGAEYDEYGINIPAAIAGTIQSNTDDQLTTDLPDTATQPDTSTTVHIDESSTKSDDIIDVNAMTRAPVLRTIISKITK
uniref:Uncharacterized protein n=1 Tax=Romanomermis culicivorax TaxID=13658 RepID=A0A915L940_ROMCU